MIRTNTRQFILGVITMVLLLIVILGTGMDSAGKRKKPILKEIYPENTRNIPEFEFNYHIQPGSLPY